MAVWLTGFTRDEPSIKFVEFRTSPDGFPIGVFKMINPTGQSYTYEANFKETPETLGRLLLPSGWQTTPRDCGLCRGSFCELAPHSTRDFQLNLSNPPITDFAIGIHFLPGTPAENASKRGGIPFYRNLPKFIRQFIPDSDPTWSDSVRFPLR